MTTIEDVKKIIFKLDFIYKNLLTKDDDRDRAIIQTWFEVLKVYPREILYKAVEEVIRTNIYTNITPGHIGNAADKIQNQHGIEFANRIIDILKRNSILDFKDMIFNEFGQLGLDIYIANKKKLESFYIDETDKIVKDIAEIYNKKLWIQRYSTALIESTKVKEIANE